MKFPRVFKSVNQVSYDSIRLVAGRNAIKRGRMILAVRTGERRPELAGVWPGTNLAKGRFDPDSRFQATWAKPALL
jgi:hypothetical protein